MFAEMFHQAAATRLFNRSLSLRLTLDGSLFVCKTQRVDYRHIAAAVTRRSFQIWTRRASEQASEKDDGRPPLVSSINAFFRD